MLKHLLFTSIQGEEICVALQTHINDVMLRRYSKARGASNGSVNGDLTNTSKPLPSVDVNEKQVEDLSKALDESQKNVNQVSNAFLIKFLSFLFVLL